MAICHQLLYACLWGIKTLTGLDRVYKHDFGPLIGRNSSCSRPTVLDFFNSLATKGRTEELMLQFAKKFISQDIVKLGVLYIDGHFVPYWGSKRISKGFYTIRRLAAKGSLHYFINDHQNRPLFFLLKEGTSDMRDVLVEIVHTTRKIIENNNEPLTLVFDRGGWSANLFKKIDQELKVKFITWRAHEQGEIDTYPENKFKLCLLTLATKKVVVKQYENRINLKEYGEIRQITIMDRDNSTRRTSIITNDEERTPKEILTLMLSRWGQENFFKTMKKYYYLDYFPGFDVVQLNDTEITVPSKMVKNPRFAKIKSHLKKTNEELKSLRARLTTRRTNAEKDMLLIKIKKLEMKKKGLLIQQKKVPQRITEEEAYEMLQLNKFDFEKKRFLDLLKIIAYNIEQQCLEQLTPYSQKYQQDMGLRPILRMLVERGGALKLINDKMLQVTIEDLGGNQQNHQMSCFLQYLNRQNIKTLDQFQFQVVFNMVPYGKYGSI